jgi:hypothetical protein
VLPHILLLAHFKTLISLNLPGFLHHYFFFSSSLRSWVVKKLLFKLSHLFLLLPFEATINGHHVGQEQKMVPTPKVSAPNPSSHIYQTANEIMVSLSFHSQFSLKTPKG